MGAVGLRSFSWNEIESLLSENQSRGKRTFET